MPDHSERALATHAGDAAALPQGIHRIALPTPFPIGRVNCYLLEGDPLTLVDTGVNTATSLDVLEQVLAGLGHRIADIELLLLTHEHLDHLGLATVIARRADCEVAAYAPLQALFDPEQDPNAAFGARLNWSRAQLERGGYPRELSLGSTPMAHIMTALGSRPVIDRPLRDGDTVRAGGRTWEVRHRPGHSPSDLLFIDRERQLAISGDHVLAGTSSNPILAAPLEVHQPDETTERLLSLPLFVDSMRRTAAEDLLLMLSGHGPLVGPPGELIAERLAFHDRRAAKLEGMLGDEPLTIHDLARRMWKDVVMVQPHLTHSEVLGHLDLLAAEDRVTEVPVRDGVSGYVRAG